MHLNIIFCSLSLIFITRHYRESLSLLYTSMFVSVACTSKRKKKSASGLPIDCTLKMTGFRINSASESERKNETNVLFQQVTQFAMHMVDTLHFTAMIMKVQLTCPNLMTVAAMLVARDCQKL